MQVEWTALALDELREIDEWRVAEAGPDLTVRTSTTIRRRSKFLENVPRGGRPHRDGHRVLRFLDTPYPIRHRIGDLVEVPRVHRERENGFVEP